MNPAWITNSTLRLPVVNIALMSDKIAVSDWTAAVFVSSILEEAGIMDEANKKFMLFIETKLGELTKE